MNTIADAAPFTCSSSALSFAYRHTHGNYPPNMLGQWAKRKGGACVKSVQAAHGQDAALLAGWVRQAVEGGNGLPGLQEPLRSVLLAKYSTDSRMNLLAKLVVVESAAELVLGTGEHRHKMVDLCVQRYFGGTTTCADGVRRPIRQHQIADQCDVSQPTVSANYSRIKAWLIDQERAAMALVEQYLSNKGLVA